MIEDLRAAEDDGDAVVALRDGDGEEEGFVAGAGFAGDLGGGHEVEAGGADGEAGSRAEGREHAVGGAASVLHKGEIGGLRVSGDAEGGEGKKYSVHKFSRNIFKWESVPFVRYRLRLSEKRQLRGMV